MDLFENAVFMLSCGRVKTELFENADVTASIYDVSEHAHGSLGITQGHFDCLFSFVKVRTAEFECSIVGETRYALSEEAYVSPLLWVTAHVQKHFGVEEVTGA